LSQAKKAKIELTFERKRGNSAAKAIITKSDLIDTTILYSVYRAINKKINQECLGQSLILKYLMINLFLLLSILLKCDLSGIHYYALQLPANVFVILYTYITTL
jgi:hypothetical protein